MGFLTTLTTNASLIDEKYAKLLAKYPPMCTLVTLYGADAETYQTMCGNGAAFDKTIRGLEHLKDISTFLEVRTTFIKDNKDQLDRLREIGHRYTRRYAINYMVFGSLPGVCSPVSECRLTPQEAYDVDANNRLYYEEKRIKAREEARAQGKEAEIHEKMVDVSFQRNKKMKDIPKKETATKALEIFPTVLSCSAAKSMCAISWDGRMLACGAFSSPYTLPLEEGFKAAWDRLPTLFEGITHPKKCQGCEYFSGCPNCLAYLQSETGSFDEAPEYICEMAKERRRRRILRESQEKAQQIE
jgi:radical SAM protein with 4Fe4S-binding SPASM domain